MRLKILSLLEEGSPCVREIWSALGISQPLASLHLRILRDEGVVEKRREGTRVCYSLREGPGAALVRLIKNRHGEPEGGAS